MYCQSFIKPLLLIVVLVLSGCASNNPTNNLQVSAPISETTETEAETIRMNNCGGKAEAAQTAERTQAVSIAGEVQIGVGYEILEGAVTAKYVKTNTVSKRQTLTAPPGTNMEFVLLWFEEVTSGIITIEGKSGQATYRVSTPIAVELASSLDLGCAGAVQPPAATQQPQAAPTSQPIVSSSFTQDDISALVGAGNWSCLPGWPNGISIKNVPANFAVRYPLIRVDKENVPYSIGETVPSGGLATGWLQSDLPNNECSTIQSQISQSDLNAILGIGNWFCLAESPSGVKVREVPSNFVVQSPLAFVDKLEVRYSIGETVPSGGPATVWLQGDLSQSQCP